MTVSTRPPIGRPRGFDTGAVLDGALELFWRSGYRSTTTRELEAKLGLSQSSIYNAFGSKQDLMTAALDRYESRISTDLIEPLESSPKGLVAIDEFFRSFGYWITHEGDRGCMLVNLMAEDGGETDEIRERTRRYRNRVRSSLRRALRRAVDLGETGPEAIDLRAESLMAMVLALNIAARGGATVGELRKMIASARYQITCWSCRDAGA